MPRLIGGKRIRPEAIISRNTSCEAPSRLTPMGVVEVLTVVPGAYGVMSVTRPGHFHLIVRPSKEDSKKYDELTTQLYVCKGNDTAAISRTCKDPRLSIALRLPPHVLLICQHELHPKGPRRSRRECMVDPFCEWWPTLFGLPELSCENLETTSRVEVWNKRLSELGDVRICRFGEH